MPLDLCCCCCPQNTVVLTIQLLHYDHHPLMFVEGYIICYCLLICVQFFSVYSLYLLFGGLFTISCISFMITYSASPFVMLSEEFHLLIIITKPTNALIVCNLFLNHFFKTFSLLLHVSIAYCLSSSGSTYSS